MDGVFVPLSTNNLLIPSFRPEHQGTYVCVLSSRGRECLRREVSLSEYKWLLSIQIIKTHKFTFSAIVIISGVDRSLKVGGGGGDDFWFLTKNILRTNARERSDRAGGECGRGCPPSHGREIFQFWGSESCNLVHEVMNFLTLYLIRIWIKIRGGSSFFPRGGGLTQRRCRASSTSREAASRFFLLFWTPVSDVFLASTNGMMAFFYAQAMSEPRSGEPIFLVLFWTPVSDVFLASTNHMMAFFYAHITCSLGSPRGGGGGLNPIVWGWAWDRVL